VNETKWNRDKNQEKSLKLLLDEYSGPGNEIEIIPLHTERGINAVAFGIRTVLAEFGNSIEELAMDSTCMQYSLC
jgi:hypothetical protein